MKKELVIFALTLLFSITLSSQTNNAVLAFEKSIEKEKMQDYAFAIGAILDLKDTVSYEVNLRLGWLYYKSGLKKKSMYYYNKAIAVKPNAIEPRYGFTFPAYLLEDFDQLIIQDKKILEIDPNNKTVNSNLALIYYYSKDYRSALPYFEKIVRLYPFDYETNLSLGWTYIKTNNLVEAEKCFNTVLTYSPKDVSATEGLTYTKNASPIAPSLLDALGKSYELSDKSDYKGAIEVLKTIYDPQSYYINLRLGWLSYLAGFNIESINYYKLAMQMSPNSIEPKLGCAYPTEALGNKTDLIKLYESVLLIDPNNTLTHYKLGMLDYSKKEYQTAFTHFEKIVVLYPCDTDALLMLAWTSYNLGKSEESKVLFNKVLCLSPKNESALLGLGIKNSEPTKKTTGF
jgi:tetratricopeptide (TPR) repeat protein